MRPYVLALVSAVAIASQSALAADPPPQPPMPVPQSGAKHMTLPKEQINHLKSAADHLAKAGRKHDADKLREQIAVIESGQASALLAKKEKELKALQSEVEQLRKLTRQQPQIVLAFRVLQFSRQRLKHFELENIDMLLAQKGGTFGLEVIDDPSKVVKLVEQLRERDLVKVLAEPTIVTVSGRPARFHSGGEVPTFKPGADSKASIEYVRFGTEIDVVPIVGGGDQVRLELRLRVAEIDPARSVTVGDYTMPSVRSFVVDTAAEMRLGQSLILGGMSKNRVESQLDEEDKVQKADNEIETIVIVTPTRVDETEVEVHPHVPGTYSYGPPTPTHNFYIQMPTATKAVDAKNRK